VSPGKTIEGLFGGIVITTLLAIALAPWFTPFNLIYSACFGLLISLTGFIGDITVSALKRDLGIKDSGNLIPGHGGILDRIDSLTYTAPLFFISRRISITGGSGFDSGSSIFILFDCRPFSSSNRSRIENSV
jgi:predicted CDP-diglyceride synthetase/phosphatidate cytidylyltransferase